MTCEQFFFESSYLLEDGANEGSYEETRDHLRACASCRALVERMSRRPASVKQPEIPTISLEASRRLHQALDAAFGETTPDETTVGKTTRNDPAPVLSWPRPATTGAATSGWQPVGTPWIGIAATCVVLAGLVVAMHFCPPAPPDDPSHYVK